MTLITNQLSRQQCQKDIIYYRDVFSEADSLSITVGGWENTAGTIKI